jgi:hydroxymethylbilane synthase
VKVRIGTRGSELALWQARRVAEMLERACGIASVLVPIRTSGDVKSSHPLQQLSDVGVFVAELQEALRRREVDIAVHSLKDLPTSEPEGLVLAAVPLRGTPAELLLARAGAAGSGGMGLRPQARLGTSSQRRAAQALARQPDLRILPLRGNVPTRVGKLREGAYDAVLLAAAGVERLALDVSDLLATRLAVEEFLPAPGQGALAVEARREDAAMLEAAGVLNDPAAAEATACERAVLAGLGGGCHLPLGAFAFRDGERLRLTAALGEIDADLMHARVRSARAAAASAGEAAEMVLAELRKTP